MQYFIKRRKYGIFDNINLKDIILRDRSQTKTIYSITYMWNQKQNKTKPKTNNKKLQLFKTA